MSATVEPSCSLTACSSFLSTWSAGGGGSFFINSPNSIALLSMHVMNSIKSRPSLSASPVVCRPDSSTTGATFFLAHGHRWKHATNLSSLSASTIFSKLVLRTMKSVSA